MQFPSTKVPDSGLDERWLLAVEPELLVLNKPSGLSVLRDRSGQLDLWQRLAERFGKLYQVHRLDKATSGLLLVARNQALQSRLTRAFSDRTADKLYLANVCGNPHLRGSGRVDLPLRKGRKSRYRVAAPRETIERLADHWHSKSPDGQGLASVTRLRKLSANEQQTLLALKPLTGRSHQLRVHLAWIGHPILGDPLYGKPNNPAQQAPRLQLHAARLRIAGIGQWQASLAEGSME